MATGMMPMTVGMQPPNAIMPSMECPAMRRRGLMGFPCTIGHRRHVRVGRCSFSMSSRNFPCKNCTIRHSQLKVLSLPRLGSVVIGTGRLCALNSCQGWKMQVQHVKRKSWPAETAKHKGILQVLSLKNAALACHLDHLPCKVSTTQPGQLSLLFLLGGRQGAIYS